MFSMRLRFEGYLEQHIHILLVVAIFTCALTCALEVKEMALRLSENCFHLSVCARRRRRPFTWLKGEECINLPRPSLDTEKVCPERKNGKVINVRALSCGGQVKRDLNQKLGASLMVGKTPIRFIYFWQSSPAHPQLQTPRMTEHNCMYARDVIFYLV